MRFIYFFLVFVIIGCCIVGCGGKKPSSGKAADQDTYGDNNTGVVFNPSGVFPPLSPGNVTGNVNQGANAEKKLVHIFKYTGRTLCEFEGGTSLSEMEIQLQGIQVHDRYDSEDGKEHSGCYTAPSGDINVYVIDQSSLQLSEQRGFCECTPKDTPEGESLCVPYEYDSPPSSGCV